MPLTTSSLLSSACSYYDVVSYRIVAYSTERIHCTELKGTFTYLFQVANIVDALNAKYVAISYIVGEYQIKVNIDIIKLHFSSILLTRL